MQLLSSIARLLAAGVLTLTAAAACGGRSFDVDAGAASASGGARQGAGAGSGARSGGTAAGGSSAAGGTLGIAWPKECSDPPEAGVCKAYFERWYLDIATGICKPFVYGGCGGNDNNYESLAACQEACPSTNPSYDHCDVAADCRVASPACCGFCDGPDVTAHALIAYAKRYEMNVEQACTPMTCNGCPELPEMERQLKYFVPDCVNHQCVVSDIRTHAVTACTSDQDCFIRYGTGCCPGCDPSERVAISNFELLEELICGEPQPCPGGCSLLPQPEATAYCDAGGHCAVKSL